MQKNSLSSRIQQLTTKFIVLINFKYHFTKNVVLLVNQLFWLTNFKIMQI
jgi:hypothetical protein